MPVAVHMPQQRQEEDGFTKIAKGLQVASSLLGIKNSFDESKLKQQQFETSKAEKEAAGARKIVENQRADDEHSAKVSQRNFELGGGISNDKYVDLKTKGVLVEPKAGIPTVQVRTAEGVKTFGVIQEPKEAKAGFSPDGKQMSETATMRVSAGRDAFDSMSTVRNSMKEYKSIMGPVEGRFRAMNPYDVDAQNFNSAMRIASQNVGKFMEDGVLRKEDEEKYKEMLPNISDKEEVAEFKLQQVSEMLQKKHNQNVQALKDQGYSIKGLELADESKKQTDKFKIGQVEKGHRYIGNDQWEPIGPQHAGK